MIDRPADSSIVVCFAVPDESRLFRDALQGRHLERDVVRFPLPAVRGHLDGRSVLVVHTGIGDSPAARAHLGRRLDTLPISPRAVISAGYAGALAPELTVGDLVLGENHSDPSLAVAVREWLPTHRLRNGQLVTAAQAVETVAAKRALGHATGGVAVDMETAWIADLCTAAGVPLLSLRVISDAAGQDFPVPGDILYDVRRQRPRYLALPGWLAWHPARIAPFIRFVRGLGPARVALTQALRTVVARL